ncbi:MAG: 50S ribosomal protein L25/general stress protein Ctc [Alphaproteobacteria bacterium]|nr:50S ribosomal protein L25/general stress protein Ctc [Alphaproteobacteria bacterium]
MADIVLKVEVRERAGKGGAREARRAGLVPGVLYGGERGPIAISLERKEVAKALKSGKFLSHVVQITHKGELQDVFAQDIQFNPVSDEAEHLDLFRVEEGQLIKVNVPVHFVGEAVSPGLKRGGTLNVVRHEVELLCPANAIPEFLEFDVSTLDIGETLKISAITMPENVRPTIKDRDFTIATIQGRGGKDDADEKAESEAATAAAAASAPTDPKAAPVVKAAPAKAAPTKK